MIYRFGHFEFEGDSLRLTKRGTEVRLEPQPAKALATLLARAGDVVTKDELRAAIWPAETHVDFDRGLAYCLNGVRTALGDHAQNPRFVETLPRRGYRFIAPVTHDPPATPLPVDPVVAAARSTPRARALAVIASLVLAACVAVGVWLTRGTDDVVIAVSVFDNETGDGGYDLPLSRIADTVVQKLAESDARLLVVGNMPSVRRPRSERDLIAIADETHARFVVLGQLQRRDERVSLFLQLIRLRDGAHVWVDRIERPPGDALAGVEDDAAAAVERGVTTRAVGGSRP
jgi:DNA-binding winged helix-turn-helix (wHTH) protein/TolB-like protein